MRRMMLNLSQEKLGDHLDLTFQQVQKYEKGTNRIGASRLSQIATFLEVPVSFFFEGAPSAEGVHRRGTPAPSPGYITDFLASREGLELVKAFQNLKSDRLRRSVVTLVTEMNTSG